MASTSNLGPTQGPILLGKNYEFWSLRMRSFLQAQECWEPVDLGYVEPDPAALTAMTNAQRIAQATLRTKENKAKFWIQNSVDDSIFSKITGAGTSKQAWDILKTSYQGNDRVKTVKLQSLWTQFETLKMTESETVDQFMTRVMGIVNQIRLIGETITDQRIVEKILRSLPRKFEMVVTAILESKDLSSFSTDELIGSLVTHETRLHLTDESISNAFKTQFSFSKGRGRGRNRGTKEEGAIKITLIPVEVTVNNIRIQNSKVTEIHHKINIRTSSLKEAEGEGRMTNPTFNVFIAKSMGITNLNAGRSRQISSQAEHMCQIIWETPQEVCFSHAIKLNNNLKISGCWTVDAAIT
jgi:hypothetical protein